MSVQLGISRPAEIPALKSLWKQAFGDEDAFVDTFFETVYTPEAVLVLREDEQVRAMACWLPETLCWAGKGWPAAYLYAVATQQAARGRGHCGRLLQFAADFLMPRGIKLLTLVPGAPSLRAFYAAHGFCDFSTVDWAELTAAPAAGRAQAVSAPEYLELRERLLADQAYVSCPVPVLEFQARLARLYGGGLFRMVQGTQEGCACVARDGARGVLYELLWPGDKQAGASLAASLVGAEQLLVRTPGGGTPFAMAKWLMEKPKYPTPYLGIALD